MPSGFRSDDLQAFVEEFGSPVICGSQRTMALLDMPDALVLSQRVQTTGYRITYPTRNLVGLKHKDEVLIGITPGWAFDASGMRLEFKGEIPPENAITGTFAVQGIPSLLDNGEMSEAQLELIP